MRRRRLLAVLVAAACVATGAVLFIHHLFRDVIHPQPSCTVGSGVSALLLVPDQAADASTIAAVAKRMGLPDHAVTIALATSLQESKLHNYPFGDRDSLGLFQQRPSQGWGQPSQLLTPAYAARAFYRHLRKVPGWQHQPVATAAQAVQHSADGAAYAQWEEQARAMARALTGELEAGMACQFDVATAPHRKALVALADKELGVGALHRSSASAADDWTVAEWLVAHAYGYGVTEVRARGRRWDHERGTWVADPHAADPPAYVLAPAGVH
jgi:hypothetical protein